MSDARRTYGQRGEQIACEYLERRGYRLIDTNVRFGKTQGLIGELDIVAWDSDVLCFIEVKTRRNSSQSRLIPAEAVTSAKQKQIAALALAYTARCDLLDTVSLRFDVVAVILPTSENQPPCVSLLQGAFDATEAPLQNW